MFVYVITIGWRCFVCGESAVTIRRAIAEDASSVVAGIEEICSEGGAFYVSSFVPSIQWSTVLERPHTVPDHLLVIAESDGGLVAAGRLFPEPSHSLCEHVAELGMFVLRPYRCQGIGSGILQHIVEWADKQAVEKIVLRVFASNMPAIRLYENSGFGIEGRQKNQIKVGNDYRDLIWMARFRR